MENIRHSSQGLGQALFGFSVLVLMLLGITGTIYKLLAPGGWIAQAFGRGMTSGLVVLAALAFLGMVSWFSRSYAGYGHRTRFSDLVVYGFTAAGLVYAVRFGMTGIF